MSSAARDYQASMGYRGSEGYYVAGAGWSDPRSCRASGKWNTINGMLAIG